MGTDGVYGSESYELEVRRCHDAAQRPLVLLDGLHSKIKMLNTYKSLVLAHLKLLLFTSSLILYLI